MLLLRRANAASLVRRVPRNGRRWLSDSPSPSDPAVRQLISLLDKHPRLLRAACTENADVVRKSLHLPTSSLEAFERADGDGNRVLTEAEFRSWYSKFLPTSGGVAGAAAVGEGKEPSAGEGEVEQPSTTALRRLAIGCMVPFIGFGFLDNAIMIVAGDQIDAAFGATLGLSTLAAAGFGNLLSDVAGIQASGFIERFASRLGLPESGLTQQQLKTSAAQRVNMGASALGIAIGCLLGMLPLFLMEDEETRMLRAVFNEIDVDRDGTVRISELERALTKFGIEFDRKALTTIFDEIDQHHHHALDFSEFVALVNRWKDLAKGASPAALTFEKRGS